MVFDNLNVRISAATQDFERGISSAERSLTGLVDNALQASGALQVLQGRADEAEDEIDSAGRSATTTSGTFTALSASTEGLSLSFGSLSASLTTTLIPALILLSTVLVPITATIGAVAVAAGALAGAFGLVIGSGIVAYNKELKNEGSSLVEVLKGLKEELEPIIASFGKQFVPLIKDAIRAIPDLVRNTLDAVGGMDSFANALRSAGRTAFRLIPQIVSGLMDLARDALPMLIDGATWLIQNGPGIFKGMMQTARNVGPELLEMAQIFAQMLPTINRIGSWIINTGVPAFKSLLDILSPVVAVFKGIGNAIDGINELPRWMKVGAIVAIAAAIGVLSGGILGLVAAITAVAVGWEAVKSFIVTDAIPAINDAIEGVMDFFGGLADTIMDTLAKGFARAVVAVRLLLNKLFNAYATIFNGILSLVQEAMNGVVETLTNALNGVINTINQAIQTIPWDQVPGVDSPGQLSTIDAPTLDFSPAELNRRTTDRQVVQREVVERIGRITVENGEIVAKMDQRADERINQRERRSNRQTGRNTNVGR